MIIYGLSGKSGTGKSYNAMELCGKMQIPAIIDDGLFIFENTIAGGKSAKKQPTMIGAIKTALFTDDDHAEVVKKAIKEANPSSILILGTSDEMVRRIAARLELPQISEIIHIEDITTPEQREKAEKSRGNAGMHVIPAPTFQVRKQFSGFFLDAKRSFSGEGGHEKNIEKTVVRPSYSYLGEYTISDKVIFDIAKNCAAGIAGINEVLFTAADNSDDGMYIRVIIQMKKSAHVLSAASALQLEVFETVAQMTSFNILGVEVEIHNFV